MKNLELKGNWNEQKGRLKKKFAILTDNDLMYEKGKQDEMLGRLQIKLGKTKEELHQIMTSIMAVFAFALLAGGLFTSCTTSAEKVENAQENVVQANEDLDQANREYQADMAAYRVETAATITANDEAIAQYQARMERDKKAVKADYKRKVAELKQKNSDMKKRLDDYQDDGRDKWVTFKAEFSHDMSELGKAFKDITVKNVK